jgi:hypothetical protein
MHALLVHLAPFLTPQRSHVATASTRLPPHQRQRAERDPVGAVADSKWAIECYKPILTLHGVEMYRSTCYHAALAGAATKAEEVAPPPQRNK